MRAHREDASIKRPHTHSLALLTALLAAAFLLRIMQLGDVPLRGDEAFAVRYWADDPATVVRDLAQWEPHPLGTFLSFWVWKSAAGSSEFAMRALSLLGGWLGVAATGALARSLLHNRRAALVALALAAVHPSLIWHAQDARNYALWFGASSLAMGLFLRATARNRRRDWALYLIAETAALYFFFLEAFLLVVQAAYLLVARRPRRVVMAALRTWLILGILLLPWFVQAWYLAQSGYEGATSDAAPARLLTWFVPVLLSGREYPSPWEILLPLAWIAALVWLWLRGPHRRQGVWLVAWIMLPVLLLLIAATRMSVFDPRYLIATVPAFIILTAGALTVPHTDRPPLSRPVTHGALALLLAVPVLGITELGPYYRGDSPKAPDWPGLAAYLQERAAPGDLVLQVVPDPAFGYYYPGPADETSLVPDAPIRAQLQPQVNFYRGIWLVGRLPEAEGFLADAMQQISYDVPAGFDVMQFRRWTPHEAEIAVRQNVRFGEIVRLAGHTLQGPGATAPALTVLLYWEPLAQSAVDYTVFVHLSGAPNPATGSSLWDQDDHRPLDGFASTLAWEPGTLYRDPYHLLGSPELRLAPGTYTLEVGLYNPQTGDRLPVYDAAGALLGDSFTLTTLRWPPS